MISNKLDKFFEDYFWMLSELEYEELPSHYQDSYEPTTKRVPVGPLKDKSKLLQRQEKFFDIAEKNLDGDTLKELAIMFQTAKVKFGAKLDARWQNYLTLTEAGISRDEVASEERDRKILKLRKEEEPEINNILGNRSGKEYTGQDAVYMIVGQVDRVYDYSKETVYYSTIKNNWVKNALDGTQYDTYNEAEEDLWDAENLFIDSYSGKDSWGNSYKLAVKIVGRKPRRGDHKNLKMENIMNIYEQLNKINDNESLSEKYNVKNAKELKKLKESINSIKVPAPWNKYLEVNDYTPEEGEYAVGDKIGNYTLVAYLIPKAEYEDIIDEWPMLFKNAEGYVVGTTSHDRVYPYDVEDFGLTESLNEDEELTNTEKLRKIFNIQTTPKTIDAAARATDVNELVDNIVKTVQKSGITPSVSNSAITIENKDGSKTTYIVKVKQVPQYVLEEEMIGDIVRTFDEDDFIKKSAVKIVDNK